MDTNWAETNAPVRLSANEVRVWAVPLDDVRAAWGELMSVLSPDERARAERFALEEPRRRFVAARAALRGILGRALGCRPQDVPLTTEMNGKPRLADAANAGDLQFNLAHSGELTLVALSSGCPVGVDVERLRPIEHLRELAARYFHPQELAAVNAASGAEAPAIFLRCWTRKEAVLKAVGIGIGYPLDAFHVPMEATGGGWVEVPAHASVPATRCWVEPLDPSTDYVSAVATLGLRKTMTKFAYSL